MFRVITALVEALVVGFLVVVGAFVVGLVVAEMSYGVNEMWVCCLL